jgi:hypothetical protein
MLNWKRLYFADKGEKTRATNLNWPVNDLHLPVRSRVVHHFQYIEIPLKLSYGFFTFNKINCFGSAGVSLGVFIAKKTNIISEYAHEKETSYTSTRYTGYTKFNPSVNLSFGFDYQLSGKLAGRLEPVYQHSIASIVADDSAREFLFSFGINISLYYALRNAQDKDP